MCTNYIFPFFDHTRRVHLIGESLHLHGNHIPISNIPPKLQLRRKIVSIPLTCRGSKQGRGSGGRGDGGKSSKTSGSSPSQNFAKTKSSSRKKRRWPLKRVRPPWEKEPKRHAIPPKQNETQIAQLFGPARLLSRRVLEVGTSATRPKIYKQQTLLP